MTVRKYDFHSLSSHSFKSSKTQGYPMLRAMFSAAPLLGVLALSGCNSMERIHQNMKT